ncbi:hypothetical protein SAMN05443572_107344 [Myxococcus fulvus]|uniref:Lipoprotein n=1 Tax=Myxococcus fulvus TaxID=33 RepID=A0A511TDD3_MYXFU|nr:hypothetical protein [Myxococcus fulvus]AKF86065.1 hypothetical protein MFUL124B02_21150 [Myxococcus fulvus 124B02]GEN12185.1 hypothetical protein MFU01_72220 [Myxococcus fulvus]SEU26915.1 hypothetical protein SAMN05443572_107344 [Myxococcus fulvus]
MQMRNWLVSTVLGIGLVGGVGCGPLEDGQTPGVPAEPTQPEPSRGGSVSAMAATGISWADFSATQVNYVFSCATSVYAHSCAFCAADGLYASEYATSGCTSPGDITHTCFTCDKALFPMTERVELPDGDLIDVTIDHGVAASNVVEFRLQSASGISRWKQVTLLSSSQPWKVWNESGNSWCNWPSTSTANCDTNSEWSSIVLDPSTRFLFSKSKGLFGTHTDVYELSNLSARLTGGDRVTFRWVQD